MKNYAKPNATCTIPNMRETALTLLAAARQSTESRRYVIDDLRLVIQQLQCDDAAAILTAAGIEATTLPHRESHAIYQPALCVGSDCLDGEAAARICELIRSGLNAAEAVRRVTAQADTATPVMSPAAIESLERDVRREEREDIQRRVDAGQLSAADAAELLRASAQ